MTIFCQYMYRYMCINDNVFFCLYRAAVRLQIFQLLLPRDWRLSAWWGAVGGLPLTPRYITAMIYSKGTLNLFKRRSSLGVFPFGKKIVGVFPLWGQRRCGYIFWLYRSGLAGDDLLVIAGCVHRPRVHTHIYRGCAIQHCFEPRLDRNFCKLWFCKTPIL